MGLKVRQNWVIKGLKAGQNSSKPTFYPAFNPFRDIDKNPFLTHFKGGELFAEKGSEAVPTQHNTHAGKRSATGCSATV